MILAFVVCSVMASIAGFYLAAEVQIGSPIIGNYALESIAAAVLGGASLAGGRGSFVGALLAALFLSLIDNVLPLFHQPTEYAEMTIGVLILLALVLYQSPELLGRLRTSRGGVGRPTDARRRSARGLSRPIRRPRPRPIVVDLAAEDDPDRGDCLVAVVAESMRDAGRSKEIEPPGPSTCASKPTVHPELPADHDAELAPVVAARASLRGSMLRRPRRSRRGSRRPGRSQW